MSVQCLLFECPKRWRWDFPSHRTAAVGPLLGWLLWAFIPDYCSPPWHVCVPALHLTDQVSRQKVAGYRSDFSAETMLKLSSALTIPAPEWRLTSPLSCHPPAELLPVWVKALLGLCAALLAEHTWEGVCSCCLGTHAELRQKSISVIPQLAAVSCRASGTDWIDRINVTPGGLSAANQKRLVLMNEMQ